jgi:hypothetical protein
MLFKGLRRRIPGSGGMEDRNPKRRSIFLRRMLVWTGVVRDVSSPSLLYGSDWRFWIGSSVNSCPGVIGVVSVLAFEKGSMEHLFASSPKDDSAQDTHDQPSVLEIECGDGHATFGMPNAYTMRMLFTKFCALVPGWRLLPTPCYRRNPQGWVIHETLTAWKREEDLSDDDTIVFLSPRTQEGAERGTEINLRSDQLPVLDYWAQAEQSALVGISLTIDGRTGQCASRLGEGTVGAGTHTADIDTLNSDEGSEEMTEDQLRAIRRFRKGGRPLAVSGKG